jgi:formylmethanofuran dehydrogenase subunit E
LERFHGRADPWLVAGLRVGKAARHALRSDGLPPRGLRVSATAPPEARAALDGIQLGAGCTLGRGDFEAGQGSKVEVVAEAAGRTVRVALQAALAAKLQGQGTGARELAVWVWGLPEDEVVTVA